MDVNYINPFLAAFKNIMPQLGINDVQKIGFGLKSQAIQSPGVLVIIGVIGDIKGNIIYGMSVETAKKIASVMMMGAPVDDFGEMPQSAVSELINMLTANAATQLSNGNISVDISTPTLIHGTFTATASGDKVLCIQIGLDGMVVDVNICLERGNF